VELLGFLVLVGGNLIYNKVIKLPFLESKESNLFIKNKILYFSKTKEAWLQ